MKKQKRFNEQTRAAGKGYETSNRVDDYSLGKRFRQNSMNLNLMLVTMRSRFAEGALVPSNHEAGLIQTESA